MDTKDKYIPIACSFYDHFEIAGLRNENVNLELQNGELISGFIKTLESRKGEGEFVILKDGSSIRLDKVVSINGEMPSGRC
jgi:transcriptional antiterminator Rof (Rho-off)